jgi:hypothetical protein
MAVRSTWHARFEVFASLLQLSGLNALSVMRELDRIIEVQTNGLVAGLSPIGSATAMSADRFAITSHRARNLVKLISSSAKPCGECRPMVCTIGLATRHDRPDDPRGLVRHRDGGDPGGFSREQIRQTWIDLIGIVF